MIKNSLVVFLLIHLFCCFIIYLLIKKRIIRNSMQLFPLALFIPIWGILMIGTAEYYLRRGKSGSKDIQIHRFEAEKDRYTWVRMREDSMENSVVPLEEAILINNPTVRREMILEIIQQNPQEYIEILQKARLSEDTEVSHYASASIMEIQRKYELDLQDSERQLRRKKTNEGIKEHIEILKEYIESGLLAENVQNVQRHKLINYLVELISHSKNKESYLDIIHNFIHLQNFAAANLYLEEALMLWKEDVTFHLLKLKLHFAMKDGRGLQSEIDHLKKMNIYLTPEVKEYMNFWSS